MLMEDVFLLVWGFLFDIFPYSLITSHVFSQSFVTQAKNRDEEMAEVLRVKTKEFEEYKVSLGGLRFNLSHRQGCPGFFLWHACPVWWICNCNVNLRLVCDA